MISSLTWSQNTQEVFFLPTNSSRGREQAQSLKMSANSHGHTRSKKKIEGLRTGYERLKKWSLQDRETGTPSAWSVCRLFPVSLIKSEKIFSGKGRRELTLEKKRLQWKRGKLWLPSIQIFQNYVEKFITLSLVGGDINALFSFMFLSNSHSRL